MGIKVKVGANPESDADRLTRLRDAWGDEVWLGVDANQRYDFPTALAMGHFFEEEIGADWFEEPILSEDVAGHARLAAQLEVPIAAGEMLFDREEFRGYLERNALAVLQPDVTRLGGITGWLKVAALADLYHRPLVAAPAAGDWRTPGVRPAWSDGGGIHAVALSTFPQSTCDPGRPVDTAAGAGTGPGAEPRLGGAVPRRVVQHTAPAQAEGV